MLRTDGRLVPVSGSGHGGVSRTLGVGLSLCLHGAVLSGFYWLPDSIPPEPYKVVAVELVGGADMAGLLRGQTDQPFPPAGMNAGAISDDVPADQVEAVPPPPPPEETMDRTPAAAVSSIEIEDASPPKESMAKTPDADAVPLAADDASPPEEVQSKISATAWAGSEVDAMKTEMTRKPEPTAIEIPERRPVPAAVVKRPRTGEKILERANPNSTAGPGRPMPRLKPTPPKHPADTSVQVARASDETGRRKKASSDPKEESAPARHRDTGAGRVVDKARPVPEPGTDAGPAPAASRAVASRPAGGSVGAPPRSPPRFGAAGLANSPPRYPYLARLRGQHGRVVLRVRVDAAGKAEAVAVRRSSGYGLLDGAAVKAVRKWRFVPATKAGIRVAGSLDVPIAFTLTD